MKIINSRISGNSAQKGSVAYVIAGVLRIAGSTINDSADGSFAIHDATGTDFPVQVLRAGACAPLPSLAVSWHHARRPRLQLDSVIADETFNIFSSSNVLVQNIEEVDAVAAKNATVETWIFASQTRARA